MLSRAVAALTLLILFGHASAQPITLRCDQAPDPLLDVLASWSGAGDTSLDLNFVIAASGAGLAVAYEAPSGLGVEPGQKLLWPGNLMRIFDSSYTPIVPSTWSVADSLVVSRALAGQALLIFGPRPAVVTGVDTSLGAPWFFVSLCDSGRSTTPIWDAADLRSRWWLWTDLPGANTVWPLAPPPRVKVGRRLVRESIRNLVLAARPDSTGSRQFGLAALAAAKSRPDRAPGEAATLNALAALRRATAAFIERSVELWPPARRDPLKLAAFYLQKDAEAWQTMAAVAGDWQSYDSGQRTEWLTSLADWETKAAVALDQIAASAD